MTDIRREEREIERRNPTIKGFRKQLAAHGREPHERFPNGNVRTYVWFNRLNEQTPTVVEQLRYYSTSDDWGITTLLEASDLCHAVNGLNAAYRYAIQHRLLTRRPDPVDEKDVRRSTSRPGNEPDKRFVSGNIALLLWANQADAYDVVFKAEILNVVTPRVVRPFWLASQIGDVLECLDEARDHVIERQLTMAYEWREGRGAA